MFGEVLDSQQSGGLLIDKVGKFVPDLLAFGDSDDFRFLDFPLPVGKSFGQDRCERLSL